MQLSIVLLGLSLGLVSSSGLCEVKLERGDCPMFWYSFSGRCYKYVATRLTWADAEIYCVSQKANLVSIHSLEEHNFVKSLIQNFDHAQGATWMGFSDIAKEGAWMWSDGSSVDFTLWNTGEPNNQGHEDCALFHVGRDLKWNDGVCTETYPSVCALRITCP